MFPACHSGPVNQAQTISNTIRQFREDVPDYVASGFVDLSTGMLLDVDTVANHPREILDVVAAATAHLFEGRNVMQIEGSESSTVARPGAGTTSRRSWSTATTSSTCSCGAPATPTSRPS